MLIAKKEPKNTVGKDHTPSDANGCPDTESAEFKTNGKTLPERELKRRQDRIAYGIIAGLVVIFAIIGFLAFASVAKMDTSQISYIAAAVVFIIIASIVYEVAMKPRQYLPQEGKVSVSEDEQNEETK